jgi:hypothetical protein
MSGPGRACPDINAIEKLDNNEDLHWIPQVASGAFSLGSQNADS